MPRERGAVLWSVLLNATVVIAVVISIIPIVALIRGFFELVSRSQIASGSDVLAYGLAFTGLFLGAVFFSYAIKYYLGTAIVLATTLATNGGRNGNGSGHNESRHAAGLMRIARNSNGNGNGN